MDKFFNFFEVEKIWNLLNHFMFLNSPSAVMLIYFWKLITAKMEVYSMAEKTKCYRWTYAIMEFETIISRKSFLRNPVQIKKRM